MSSPHRPRSGFAFTWTAVDYALLLILLASTGVFIARRFHFAAHPAEDAAILLRYSLHVAQGHGITWNIDEPPRDGATDFLFMMAVAGLTRAGAAVEMAARWIGIAAHLLTLALVYIVSRGFLGAPRWAALISALFLACGPGLAYAEAGFGTPLFAFFACLAGSFLFHEAEAGESRSSAAGFALSAFLCSLTRPEGVFLSALLVASLGFYRGWRASRLTIQFSLILFATAGGLYLAWRWRYFGHLLPTPFLKKGAGELHTDGLQDSLRNGVILCLPFLPAFVIGLRSRAAARRTVAAALPVAGFLVLWVLLSGEANYLMRFQYAVLPLVLITWPGLVKGIREEWLHDLWPQLPPGSRRVMVMLLLLAALGAVWYGGRLHRHDANLDDGRYSIAVGLSHLRGARSTLATTEAGLLPLYSEWRSIDTWGLNDPWLARHGLSAKFLEEQQPTVIMFHAYFSPLTTVRGEGDWFQMTYTLLRYAKDNGYVLAACYGVWPYDTHYYYVKPNLPETAAIIHLIQRAHYTWLGSPASALDFAHLGQPRP
ncbi:MAG TPA: hypothetical protein VHQ90_20070 [Thermoanaerobaculia bacterium]|nr:hypothetical protein [Thermoanaerobaculia bacterium]